MKPPITGSKTQMKKTAITGQAGSMQQAASQIKASPMPFGSQTMTSPVGKNNAATINVGNGKSANTAGVQGSKPPKHPPTAPTGGYKPKKNFGPSGKSKFYGGR